MNSNDDYFEDDDALEKSKSQVKREMHALQEMGEALANLKAEQRATVAIGDRLRAALDEWPRLRHHEARRRHLQFIGKLMRAEDHEAIQEALDRFDSSSQRNVDIQHTTERWREQLLSDNDDAVTDFMSQYPNAEAQHLRTLIRNAKKDLQNAKNLGNGRKLFRYIRELVDPKRESLADD